LQKKKAGIDHILQLRKKKNGERAFSIFEHMSVLHQICRFSQEGYSTSSSHKNWSGIRGCSMGATISLWQAAGRHRAFSRGKAIWKEYRG